MKKQDHQLVQKVIEGAVTREEFDAFQQRLREEPELLVLYREYALLQHTLMEEFEGRPTPKRLAAVPRLRLLPVWIGVAAAAVITLMVVLLDRSNKDVPPVAGDVAMVEFSEDAAWEMDGALQPVAGSRRLGEGGVIRLKHGQARLTLATTASAVIDGDSELVFESDTALRLNRGSGRFRLSAPGEELSVSTPTMTAVDLGTEFAIVARPGQPDELHVFEGKVKLVLPDQKDGEVYGEGEGARVVDSNTVEALPEVMERPALGLPVFRSVFEDRFDGIGSEEFDGRRVLVGGGSWELRSGEAVVGDGVLEGAGFEAFVPVSFPKELPVMLVTMEVAEPTVGVFHTPGWAGLSFYQNGQELLFFGDSYGDERTWSLDIKQGLPVVLPEAAVAGPRVVTLRYDRGTGQASLHEGGLPLGEILCEGRIPVGIEFDEIRVGASVGAAIAVRSVTVRVGNSR